MLGDRKLASSDSLEQSRFTATVLTEQTVSSTVGEFKSRVGDEDTAVEDQTGAGNLDGLASLGRGQNTSGDTIRDTVLIHLVGEALHLVHLLARGRRAIGILNGVAIGIELDLVGLLALLALELALGSLLSETLLLGCGGSHIDGCDEKKVTKVRKKRTAGSNERSVSAG